MQFLNSYQQLFRRICNKEYFKGFYQLKHFLRKNNNSSDSLTAPDEREYPFNTLQVDRCMLLRHRDPGQLFIWNIALTSETEFNVPEVNVLICLNANDEKCSQISPPVFYASWKDRMNNKMQCADR